MMHDYIWLIILIMAVVCGMSFLISMVAFAGYLDLDRKLRSLNDRHDHTSNELHNVLNTLWGHRKDIDGLKKGPW